MDGPASVPARRLAVYFAVLIVVAIGATIAVLVAGSSEHAEKNVRGGYDVSVPNACLGAAGQQFDVEQSGRFVTIESTGTGPGGKLDLRKGHLTGSVDCV